jgi:hypothetical protein
MQSKETEPANSASAAAPSINSISDPLLRLMVTQGVVSIDDVQALAALSSAELRDKLLLLLSKNKSALTTADVTTLKATTESVPIADASGESSPSATAGGLQTSGPPASPDIASVWSRASNSPDSRVTTGSSET